MQDPYNILGVKRDADTHEIKNVYRNLAKQHHPDTHPGDEENLKRFQEINAAYDILKDPKQREQYDLGGFGSWSGAGGNSSRGQQNDFGMFDESWQGIFQDSGGLFTDKHADYQKSVRKDVTIATEIDFADAVLGCTTYVTLDDGRQVSVKVPAGVETGVKLRLRGQGRHGGDSYAEIFVRPDKKMYREGRNIVVNLPISIDEAVLGGKVKVETLTGTIELMVPANSSTGSRLRLKGRGVQATSKQLAGDFLIILQIMLPDSPDSRLQEAIKNWKNKSLGYNPRQY